MLGVVVVTVFPASTFSMLTSPARLASNSALGSPSRLSMDASSAMDLRFDFLGCQSVEITFFRACTTAKMPLVCKRTAALMYLLPKKASV